MYQHHARARNGRTLHTGMLVVIAALVLMWGGAAEAQVLAPGGTTISLVPADIRPNETFTARVEAYAYDLPRARIEWRVDGTPREEYANTRSIQLTAPGLGESFTLSVRVTEPSGTVHTAQETVTASTIDVVVESDTRVPSFYRGRALPSPGSTIHIIALPSLYRADGSRVTDDIVYSWRIGGATTPGSGKSVTASMPRSGPLSVEVTASTRTGDVRHTSRTTVEPATPLNLFYEDNPLYGLSQSALPREVTLLRDEISVRAEPYFVSTTIFNNARHTWSINGSEIHNPDDDPQTLTVRATQRGSSEISFSIRNLDALRQAVQKSFRIHFNN